MLEQQREIKRMKTNTYVAWSDDGNRVALSILDHAASLLCRSVVIFGDKTTRAFEPAKLIKHGWVKDSEVNRVIEMSHVGKEDIVQATEFEGCVFYIEGQDLRLRMRAYAKHLGEAFEDMQLPKGPMALYCDSAQKAEAYKVLLDLVHKKAVK
jgi:hypothetical protein